MALLTTHSDANKQVLEPLHTWQVVNGYRTTAYLQQKKIVTTSQAEKYRYVGMTEEAAIACYNAVNSPSTGVSAKIVWVAGNMYNVEVEKMVSETIEMDV